MNSRSQIRTPASVLSEEGALAVDENEMMSVHWFTQRKASVGPRFTFSVFHQRPHESHYLASWSHLAVCAQSLALLHPPHTRHASGSSAKDIIFKKKTQITYFQNNPWSCSFGDMKVVLVYGVSCGSVKQKSSPISQAVQTSSVLSIFDMWIWFLLGILLEDHVWCVWVLIGWWCGKLGFALRSFSLWLESA